jgi:hypothetical protein
MLMLPGAVNVDLLFDRSHSTEPPWGISAETLKGVDDHFWDWILWLASKGSSDEPQLVHREFGKMSAHLLGPAGVVEAPDSIEDAIELYTTAREALEKRFRVQVARKLEREVRQALRRGGFGV